MEYSEKQLLILSNLVYLPASITDKPLKDIIDSYRAEDGSFTVDSVSRAGTGGGLNNSDVCILFDEIDKEIKKNPSFGELSATRTLNGGYVRATCYTDGNDANPVVAFRGTGGSINAWEDNFEGGYTSDTKMQNLSADFIRNECATYENITVTGHSKGGNMSQYVTVACKDKVSYCVSFDGQGFGNDFLREHSDDIATTSNKIKSISAKNDYVNLLLYPIAGLNVYVNNMDGIKNAHSSLSLLTSNTYDANGNFTSYCEQTRTMSIIDKITDKIVPLIDKSDAVDKRLMSHITGSTIATALSIENKDDAAKTVFSLGGELTAVFVKKLAEHGMLPSCDTVIRYDSVFVDNQSLLSFALELDDIRRSSLIIKERIETFNLDASYNITAKIYVERKLDRVCEEVERVCCQLIKMQETIELINNKYINIEETLSSLFSS